MTIMVKIIKEFVEFLQFRRATNYIKLERSHKLKLSTYDKEFERELAELVMSRVLDAHIKEKISRDILLWVQMANQFRLSMMRNYIKEEQDLKK